MICLKAVHSALGKANLPWSFLQPTISFSLQELEETFPQHSVQLPATNFPAIPTKTSFSKYVLCWHHIFKIILELLVWGWETRTYVYKYIYTYIYIYSSTDSGIGITKSNGKSGLYKLSNILTGPERLLKIILIVFLSVFAKITCSADFQLLLKTVIDSLPTQHSNKQQQIHFSVKYQVHLIHLIPFSAGSYVTAARSRRLFQNRIPVACIFVIQL